jgi:hypothetical protein
VPSHDISTKWLSPIIKTINERTKKWVIVYQGIPNALKEKP